MRNSIKILLVEDFGLQVQLIRDQLSDRYCEIVDCGTIERAKQELAKNRYDVILLDLNLPDGQGIDTFLRMKAMADMLDTPIVVLTGEHDSQLGIHIVSLGAQDYLAKGSYEAEELNIRIRYAVARHINLSEALQDLKKACHELREQIRLTSRSCDSVSAKIERLLIDDETKKAG